MTFTSCTDEVRVKVPSFQKVTLFLQYKIFNRDGIRLHFVCLKMLMTSVILNDQAPKRFASIGFFVTSTQSHKDKHYQELIIEIKLEACNVHTKFAILCRFYYLRHSIENFSDYSLPLDVTVLFRKLKKI